MDATNAQNTDYAYSKASAQTRVTYPDDVPGTSRGYVVYSYDAALRLTRINHQDNTDTDVTYDSMGRRLTLTKGTEIDSFAYAASGVVTLAQRGVTGNLDSISKVDRSYDGSLRLTREAQTVKEGATRNVDYAYDKGANVLTLTYPSGIAVQASYDSLGRALTVKRDGSQLVGYSYVGFRPKLQIFETGTDDVSLTMTYDGASGARLTRMQYAQTGNTSLPDFSYNFDASSDITRKTFNERAGTPSEDYQYDTLHRLTHATFGQRASTPYKGYIYDDQGNHLTQDDNGTLTAGLFNAVNEQTKRGANDILYDSRGNITKDDTGKSYFYDRQNFLTRVEDNASNRIASYAYDALNRRIEKNIAGTPDTVIRFYWTKDWRLLEETDDAGTPDVKRYYVWAPGRSDYIDDQIAFVDSTGQSDATYYPCRNHNFSITAMLTTAGAVIERYDYNPYGERLFLNPDYTSRSGSAISSPIGFQGLFHDAESGLIYVRNRYLTTRGSWMTRDPLEYVDGMGMYEYLRSMPIYYVDSLGLWVQEARSGNTCYFHVYKRAHWLYGGEEFVGSTSAPCDDHCEMLSARLRANKMNALGHIETGTEGAQDVVNTAARLHPASDVIEVVTGEDIITGEELPTWERALAVVAPLVPGDELNDLRKIDKVGDGLDTAKDLSKARKNLTKAESPQWQKLNPHRGKTKTNGLNGKDRRYYEWDNTHGDIEVYGSNGKHLGTMDGTSGQMIKPAVPGRDIKL